MKGGTRMSGYILAGGFMLMSVTCWSFPVPEGAPQTPSLLVMLLVGEFLLTEGGWLVVTWGS